MTVGALLDGAPRAGASEFEPEDSPVTAMPDLAPGVAPVARDPFLARFPIPEEVAAGTVVDEERRLARLKSSYRQARSAFEERYGKEGGPAGRKPPPRGEPLDHDRIVLRSRISTLERTVLEAELSVIYARESRKRAGAVCSTDDSPELSTELRRIGSALNRSRIRKRLDDYLCEYLARPNERR